MLWLLLSFINLSGDKINSGGQISLVCSILLLRNRMKCKQGPRSTFDAHWVLGTEKHFGNAQCTGGPGIAVFSES